ncbi:MAG: F-type H+-transporting ATPase subunit b [Thermosediminibacterales bacterium]|nr:F-type H+-transporting ATPase subunit b [Thermosediminibacterales bacterium]MDK2836004.1 F-type H+-transporting ATPase subunit b [Thermosediminibacterales bacterium]
MLNKYTFFFQIINFIILYLIMRKFLFKPVTGFMEDRTRKIEDKIKKAELKQKEGEELKRSYEEKISNIKDEAEKLLKETVEKGEKKGAEIIKKAKEESKTILQKAMQEIRREKIKSLRESREQIAELTIAAASHIIERNLNEKDQRRLIGQFIEKVENENWQIR